MDVIILYTLSAIMIAVVVLPLMKKDFWMFRIFDYPRLQKFTIIAVLCGFWSYHLAGRPTTINFIIVAALLACLVHLGILVYPFTPFGKKMIGNAPAGSGQSLNILVSNVYQDNRDYGRLLQLVSERKPDMVFVVEIDKEWLRHISPLKNTFDHHIEVPMENTYGLAFYSKFPILEFKINYLIAKDVPSLELEVEFDGLPIKIFGLHPTPPVPQENEHSTDRDAEILLVGKMAKRETKPCLVIGDLNDVAWSYTTDLFLKTSGLLDPRRGRGLYSTFHAKYPLFRWPLDHFFVSRHFGLIDMKVENSIGSDHFPISISLALSPDSDDEQKHADSDDKELAAEKIRAGVEGNPR